MLADYYSILGVSHNATLIQIKKAFRLKAMEFHPDKNNSPDAHQVFVTINQAHEILSDTIKRKKYDYICHKAEHNTKPKYSQDKEHQWEQTVKNAAERGKEKAEQYAQNYDYFSRRVLKTVGIELLIQLIGSIIFNGLSSGMLSGLALILGGIIISILYYPSSEFYIGIFTMVVGFLIVRSRYLEIVRGED